MAKFKCGVCGFIYDGDGPPEKCPKCGAPKEKFEKLTEEQSKLIDRSRASNALHMRLYALLQEVDCIAEEGIEDDLDPGCLAIFTRAKEESNLQKQRIKAEIQTHINKGKWG